MTHLKICRELLNTNKEVAGRQNINLIFFYTRSALVPDMIRRIQSGTGVVKQALSDPKGSLKHSRGVYDRQGVQRVSVGE
jgi:hypothetical protein